MNIGIGFVLKLPGHEPAMRLCKLDRFVDHAYGALGGGSYDDLGSKKAHEFAPFNAEWLCHGDHKRISLGRANHRKTNSGVTAGGLNDRLARLELSGFFSRLDHAERQSVLDRPQRVESFDLDEKVYARRGQTIDANDRCIANSLDNILINPPHARSSNVALSATRHIARRLAQIILITGARQPDGKLQPSSSEYRASHQCRHRRFGLLHRCAFSDILSSLSEQSG